MKVFTGTSRDGQLVSYIDTKRYLWPLSVLFPLLPLVGIALHARMDNPAWVLVPLVTTYLAAPLLDWVIGVSSDSPPEAVILNLERDRFYRALIFVTIPLHFIASITAVAYASTEEMAAWEFVALAALAGIMAGLAINTGHELGHKNSPLEKTLAKIVLALPAYGHFSIDHNRGHHVNVATFKDHASARMGESIYAFAKREIPGSISNAWSIESQRLKTRELPVFGAHNQILQSYALSIAIVIFCMIVFGWKALPFFAIHHAFAYWQLTSANYVEHYGLLRKTGANGRPERCEPKHSWNSDHIFTNLLLFNLQRHSDHHTHPLRRFQSLKSFDDIPSLPSGYVGMYLVAYLPWLWFRVMDKRLMALPSVEGNLDNVNLHPPAADSLAIKWRLAN